MSDEVIDGEAVDLPAEQAPEEAPEEQPLDCVVIVKQDDGAGGISIANVAVQGDVRGTEVLTLLEMAVPAWREKIGLGK